MKTASSDLIVPLDRRSGTERLIESLKSDRRTLPRFTLAPSNPYGFKGLDDSMLVMLAQEICRFQNGMMAQRGDHAKDMSPLTQDRASRCLLEGGGHLSLHKDECSACFLMELLGSHENHLVLKGGYLAAEPREVMEYANTLFLEPYQGAWVIMRTWDGLVGYLKRILTGKSQFGPWLEYGFDEFAQKHPRLWSLYTDNGTKRDNGNRFLLRTPVGVSLGPESLPEELETCDEQDQRSSAVLCYGSRSLLVRYYAQIERAGRLGCYAVPNVRKLRYGEMI